MENKRKLVSRRRHQLYSQGIYLWNEIIDFFDQYGPEGVVDKECTIQVKADVSANTFGNTNEGILEVLEWHARTGYAKIPALDLIEEIKDFSGKYKSLKAAPEWFQHEYWDGYWE